MPLSEGGDYKLLTMISPSCQFTYVNNPIVNKSIKIYGDLFGGVNYYPYLCIVSVVNRHVSGVVKSETGSGGMSFAEGRLHPALYFYI